MREMPVNLPTLMGKSVFAGFVFLFVFPASTNYRLDGYGFGAGGEENMTSTNYALDGIAGEQSDDQLQGAVYDLGAGLVFTQQANTPSAPTFTNPSDYYNRLHLVLSTGNNPTDTRFAIAISDDNWTTTEYVQNDNTVGATLGSEDRQTAVAWGGASGFDVIGLASNTTYRVKVKAMQGKFTETGYGPEATARYTVIDFDGRERLSFSENIGIADGKVIANTIAIPAYFKDGRYRFRVEILIGRYDVSQEKEFSVLPLPILSPGGGFVVTYADLLSRLGSLALLVFLLLLLWIFVFSREYMLYLRSIRHITECHLARAGFFGSRKGASY